MQYFSRILIACLALSAVSQTSLQAEPEKLTKMRKIYESEIIKRKIPILKKLASDLSALEKTFTKENKLDEAVAARKERLAVEATIKNLGSTPATKPSGSSSATPTKPAGELKEFSIPMANANLQGRLKHSGPMITNWVTTTCEATWSGGQVVPGVYDVYIDYDTYYRGGGQLKFEELNQDFVCTIPKSSFRTKMKVGTFRLGTALGFTIKANSKNAYGILRLYGVTFKPAQKQ